MLHNTNVENDIGRREGMHTKQEFWESGILRGHLQDYRQSNSANQSQV